MSARVLTLDASLRVLEVAERQTPQAARIAAQQQSDHVDAALTVIDWGDLSGPALGPVRLLVLMGAAS